MGTNYFSDVEILDIIRESLDKAKLKDEGIDEERLGTFFMTVKKLLAGAPDRSPSKHLTVHIDGASRGNPGPSGIGVVILDGDGTEIKELHEFIGNATNNIAEYKALLRGLELAKDLGATSVIVKSDSELIVNQVSGNFKVKNKSLINMYELAREKLNHFDKSQIEAVPRSQNHRADILANMAIDSARR